MKRLLQFLFALSLVTTLPALGAPAEPEDLHPDEVIKRFAQKESEFRDVWQQYTYTQHILFQVLDRDNEPSEQREMIVEVYFTNDGKRETRTIRDRGRTVSVGVTKEDISDAISMQPFVLTSEQLHLYNVEYVGREQVDELDTYVFDVAPRKMEKKERYFKGRIWVDDVDLQIVMSKGKIVPDYRDNKFPEFETVREQIDGKYWFPTWTEADDVLHFSGRGWQNSHSVHVRQLITYGDFKHYQVGTSIKFGPVQDEGAAQEPEKP